MEFIAHLKRSLNRASAQPKEPENLLELGDQLRQSPSPELASSCRLWAQELRRLHQTQGQLLNPTRGQSRRLWAEQSLIYLDLIATLELAACQVDQQLWSDLAGTVRDFDAYTEELGDSLAAMAEWSRSEHPRCLACGWDGQASTCPHCQRQTLKPIRHPRTVDASAPLANKQGQVFETILAILAGTVDLEILWQPLQELRQDYNESAVEVVAAVEDHPEVGAVARWMSQALEGLEEIERVFEDFDAQHIEDGWHRFFVSERSLAASLENRPAGQDQVLLSRAS